MTHEEIFLQNQKKLEVSQKLTSPSNGPKHRLLRDSAVVEILADPRKVREIAEEYEISANLVQTIKDGTASYFHNRLNVKTGVLSPLDDLIVAPVRTLSQGRPREISDLDRASILEDPRNIKEIALGFNISESSVRKIRSRKTYVPKKRELREIDASTKNEVLALFYSHTTQADGNCLYWVGPDIT